MSFLASWFFVRTNKVVAVSCMEAYRGAGLKVPQVKWCITREHSKRNKNTQRQKLSHKLYGGGDEKGGDAHWREKTMRRTEAPAGNKKHPSHRQGPKRSPRGGGAR